MQFPQFVAFDAFGTLIHGHRRPSPYTEVRDRLKLDREQFQHAALKMNVGLSEVAASLLGRELARDEREFVESVDRAIIEDHTNIRAFPETVATLAALKARGIPYGVVSNLARPYEIPLRSALGELTPDVFILSFEVGAMKPERKIYELFCERMGCAPEQTLFVGDKLENDFEAPRSLGFKTLLLRRGGDLGHDPRSSGREITDLLGVFPELGIVPREPDSLQRAPSRALSP